jgi:hypothetical protein
MIEQLNRFLFIVTFFFILFSSCKKEEILAIQTDHLTTINELKSLVSQIKIWHDSITNNITVGNSENNIKSLSLNSNDIIPPVIDWDKAYKNFDSTQKIGITIPLKYDPLTGNYLQLVACKFKSKISGFLVNSLLDSSYHILHKSAFDYSKFNSNVSDEFVASTIIHEIAHMLIATKFSNLTDYKKVDREKIMLLNYVTMMKSFYLYDFNDRFANGKLGTKSCNF